MGDSKRVRRRHDEELKAKVLSECGAPGASVAQVALAHGLNANLVHKWRRQAGGAGLSVTAPEMMTTFIPVTMRPGATPVADDIRIELRRGALAVNVTWPLAASAQCAGWLRELLK
jgi:transposase